MSPREPLLCLCQKRRYIQERMVPLPHMHGYVPSRAPTAHSIIASIRSRSGRDRFVSLPENFEFLQYLIIRAAGTCPQAVGYGFKEWNFNFGFSTLMSKLMKEFNSMCEVTNPHVHYTNYSSSSHSENRLVSRSGIYKVWDVNARIHMFICTSS